ncbi:MAG: hypothetical protein ACR2GG_06250 [Gemmatimonadaceae bacterium]
MVASSLGIVEFITVLNDGLCCTAIGGADVAVADLTVADFTVADLTVAEATSVSGIVTFQAGRTADIIGTASVPASAHAQTACRAAAERRRISAVMTAPRLISSVPLSTASTRT